MALIRLLLVALLLATPALAQEEDAPSRPIFLQAMGLLQAQTVEINRDDALFASLTLYQGGGIRPVPRDISNLGGDVVAAWDFVNEDGRFVESLTLTTATVDLAEAETRRFALANLLVLRSFPQLANQFPEARLLAFGPASSENDLDIIQMVGSFTTPEDSRSIVFRHIGAMHPDRAEIVIAIINIDADVLPVRSDEDLIDTFAGQSFRTIALP